MNYLICFCLFLGAIAVGAGETQSAEPSSELSVTTLCLGSIQEVENTAQWWAPRQLAWTKLSRFLRAASLASRPDSFPSLAFQTVGNRLVIREKHSDVLFLPTFSGKLKIIIPPSGNVGAPTVRMVSDKKYKMAASHAEALSGSAESYQNFKALFRQEVAPVLLRQLLVTLRKRAEAGMPILPHELLKFFELLGDHDAQKNPARFKIEIPSTRDAKGSTLSFGFNGINDEAGHVIQAQGRFEMRVSSTAHARTLLNWFDSVARDTTVTTPTRSIQVCPDIYPRLHYVESFYSAVGVYAILYRQIGQDSSLGRLGSFLPESEGDYLFVLGPWRFSFLETDWAFAEFRLVFELLLQHGLTFDGFFGQA